MTQWGEVYSHVIACTGWTWDYIAEHVDLPRLECLSRYWAQLPPLHAMVASYLGIKPQAPRQTIEDLNEQSFIPANPVSASEFDALLKSKGLSV